MSEEGNFPGEPVERQRHPAGQALIIILVAFAVSALLNADRLDNTARTQPFGWQRDWAMRITGPLKSVANTFKLTEPRRVISEGVGNKEQPPPEDTKTVVTAPPVGAPSSPDAPATTTTAPPVLRTPTDENPLKILVAGDSMMGWVGPGLDKQLEGRPVEVIEDWEVATGLARPDFMNWPARIAEDMETHDPDVVVIGFGGNDSQPMSTADGNVQLGTPEWRAEYQRRVVQILDAVEKEGRTIYWFGLPLTTKKNIETAAVDMEAALKAEIAIRPWAHYVDPRSVLSPDGTYVQYLPNSSGESVKVREGDGVHPTPAGAALVVASFLPTLQEEWHLTATAPPTTTSAVPATSVPSTTGG